MDDATLAAKGRISDGSAVHIAEAPFYALWQIAGWANFDAAVAPVCDRLGLLAPMDCRTSRRGDALTFWRIAPNRMLIVSDVAMDPPDRLPDLVTLDLSDARIRLRIDGPGATGLLARLMPVDTAPKAFPVDGFVQTGIHHVGVLIDRRGTDRFDILVPRTWSRSVVATIRLHLTP